MNDRELKDIIIKKVHQVPAIWDKRHRDHYNRYRLDKHWQKIEKEVGVSDVLVKKIWKNLRQEFGKQMAKAAADLEPSYWPYYTALDFLKDQFTPKPSTYTLMLSEILEDAIQTDDKNTVEIPTKSPVVQDKEETSNSQILWENTRESVSPIDVENKDSEQKLSIINDQGDEDIGFFNSLLPHVRNLPPQKKMLFRIQVQQSLYELSFGANMLNESSNFTQIVPKTETI